MGLLSVASSIRSAISSKSSSSYGSQIPITGYTPVSWYHFSARTIILVLMPLLSALGAYGTWGLGLNNGTFAMIGNLMKEENSLLPGSEALLLKTFTGIEGVDKQLAVLGTFFAPIVDGKDASISLYALFGLGQFGAAWALLCMESMRLGNRWRLVSFIGTFGVIFQNITFTITIPLYLFLHLLTSPVAKPFPGAHANSVLLIETWDLRILPLSITAGFLIPSILMSLPEPSIVSAVTHQKFVAFWQAFPVWTVCIHWALRSLCVLLARKFSSNTPNEKPKALGVTYMNSAKHVYRFVMLMCFATHIPAVVIAMLPADLVPASLPHIARLAKSSFADTFIPYLPLPSHQVADLATGGKAFLQWDLYIGSASLLLWAILLYRNATTEKLVVDPTTSLPSFQYRELLAPRRGQMLGRKLAWKILLWSVVSGPMGALTVLLWERDAIVRQKIKQGL